MYSFEQETNFLPLMPKSSTINTVLKAWDTESSLLTNS